MAHSIATLNTLTDPGPALLRITPPCPGPPAGLLPLTLASLKLRSKASRLAPASCTLAMDMTLPKKEKEATSSSFSRWAFPSRVGMSKSGLGPVPRPPIPPPHHVHTHLCSHHSWSKPGMEMKAVRSHTQVALSHPWTQPSEVQ